MNYIIIGTNHKCSPVEIREKVSFSGQRLNRGIYSLKEGGVLESAVILSTCNRTEIHASSKYKREGIREIEAFLVSLGIPRNSLESYFYRYTNKEAIKHLFSVASGLDSLIVGETQILSQVNHALLEAIKADFINEFLKNIFEKSIAFARKIHRETSISEGKMSVGSVAVDFIKEKVGILLDKNILILGVGKVTELVLRYLKKEGTNVIFVSNRTFDKAKELASQIKAKAVRFDALKEYLKKADIVISATASPHFIIKKETLKDLKMRKILIVDLAVPRDVDPSIRDMENIDLVYLEELDSIIKKNAERKAYEAIGIRDSIREEAENIWEQCSELEQEVALSL